MDTGTTCATGFRTGANSTRTDSDCRGTTTTYSAFACEHGDAAIADLKLAESCTKHARLYFDRRPLDLDQATSGTFGIVPADGMLEPLKADYEKMAGMIFGDVPSFEDIIGKIKTAEASLNVV